MSGKRYFGLAGAVVVGMALAGCQHRCGDRSCQTGPPYAQNTAPVPSNSVQTGPAWNTPGSGASAAMPGPSTVPNSGTNTAPAWTSTPGMGTSGANTMPAGRQMGMSTGTPLSGNSVPGSSGMTDSASPGAGSSSGSLLPPNPSPAGTSYNGSTSSNSSVPVMSQGYNPAR